MGSLAKTAVALILILGVSIWSYSAYAIPDLLIDVQPIENEISYDGIAKYSIELTNNKDEKMRIKIPTPKNDWDITIKPYLIELMPHSSKTINISISPPKTIKSGVYSIFFQFNEENVQLDYKYLHVKILEDSPIIAGRVVLFEQVEAQEFWSKEPLKKTYSVTLINKADTLAIGVWETNVSPFEQFFLIGEPEPELEKEGGAIRVKWNYEIPVGGKVVYKYTISYMPLLVTGILIGVALVLLAIYYLSRYKITKTISYKKDGFIGVELSIKNNTFRKQKNVTLEDYVPVPLMLSRHFGTMSPTAIKKQRDKLVLIWKFDELQPKEERMLSYRMKSKLKVEGKILIPPACIKQKDGKKQIEVFSKIRKSKN